MTIARPGTSQGATSKTDLAKSTPVKKETKAADVKKSDQKTPKADKAEEPASKRFFEKEKC